MQETKVLPCYDCGSTIAGHHTPLCAFAEPSDKRDLPQVPGSQWWVGGNFAAKRHREQHGIAFDPETMSGSK